MCHVIWVSAEAVLGSRDMGLCSLMSCDLGVAKAVGEVLSQPRIFWEGNEVLLVLCQV